MKNDTISSLARVILTKRIFVHSRNAIHIHDTLTNPLSNRLCPHLELERPLSPVLQILLTRLRARSPLQQKTTRTIIGYR